MTHPEAMGVKLLPCPFCGSDPQVSTYETESLWSHEQVTYTKVECPECEIAFNSEPGYEVEAPAAWNRRAAPAVDGLDVVAWRVSATDRPNQFFEIEGEADQWSNSPGVFDSTIEPLVRQSEAAAIIQRLTEENEADESLE